ncbi:MAG: RNA polymerase sigma factor [Gammaproteobacteria bacterium]|nr:RNA polymerase sigma factor [Gammaproteobacteria bacterium]
MSRFLDVQIAPALVRRLKRGDRRALAKVYDALSTPVYTLARRMLNDADAAAEVAHDTFIDVMTRASTLQDDSAVAGWVRSIAVNHCLMRLRSPWHRRRDTSPPDDRESAKPDGTEQLIDIERALARLPAETRTVIWLHEVEGYTHAEIGQMFGRTSSYSKSQLARGYARLEKYRDGDDVSPKAKDDARRRLQDSSAAL